MLTWYKPWLPAAALAAIVCAIWFVSWWGGQPSLRPRNMPRDSVWIHAPSLPFEWHHGWWFGCWIDADGRSNRCRLWGSGLGFFFAHVVLVDAAKSLHTRRKPAVLR